MNVYRHALACVAVSMGAMLPPSVHGETLDDAADRLHEAFNGPFAEATGRGLPFRVWTQSDEGVVDSRAQFLLADVPFDRFVDVLGRAPGWCESLLLHLNVKTCVSRDAAAGERLELYLGRKYYEHPRESIRIEFDFRTEIASSALRTTLTADHGPYGTSKYVFVLSAVRVPRGVFVELSLSNDVGYAGTVVDLYLNTLGRSKIGFTRTGKTIFGNPQYVRGQEGAAERNVVRYMLALQVSLEKGDAAFADRAAAWFDATERYPRQLREYEREQYLEIKRRERENQVAYQQAADRGETVEHDRPGKNR